MLNLILNRLASNYAIVNNRFMVDYHMSEKFSYDKHGNIKNLSRWDNHDESDDMTLTYDGNQLKKVADRGTSQNLYSIKECRDLADIVTEFYYDANGNMTTDLDRDIVTIRYNLLNLPELVQFKNGNQIRHTYSADGRKLSSRYVTVSAGVYNPLNVGQVIDVLDVNENDNVMINGTDYVDNKEYAVDRYFD